jgi:MoxR-like ATPase
MSDKPKYLDPDLIPFEGVYLKCVEIQKTKKLILVPEQELEVGFVIVDETSPEFSSLTYEQYYTADVCRSKDDSKTYTYTRSLTKTSMPTKEQVKGKALEVKRVFEKKREVEELRKKEAQEEFKKDNQIPAIPSDLYIKEKIWNMACASIILDKSLILLGPKGCGKTQSAKSIAEAMKMKFVSFNMGAANKPNQLFIGQLHAKANEDGVTETVLVESEFLKAYQSDEPLLIFLDEITRSPMVAVNYLMTILDKNQNYIYVPELGKAVKRGKGVRFICAGNVGMQYTGTTTIDGAFWDRFIKLTVDYLPLREEVKLISERAPKAPRKAVEILVDRANKCREAEKNGSVSSGVSTRQLIDMAHMLEIGFEVEDVFENIFLNNFINGNNNEIDSVKGIVAS